jgi:hypothetical protein
MRQRARLRACWTKSPRSLPLTDGIDLFTYLLIYSYIKKNTLKLAWFLAVQRRRDLFRRPHAAHAPSCRTAVVNALVRGNTGNAWVDRRLLHPSRQVHATRKDSEFILSMNPEIQDSKIRHT